MRKLILLCVVLLALFTYASTMGDAMDYEWQNHILHVCKIVHATDVCPIDEQQLQIHVARQSCKHVWVEHKRNGTSEVLADHCTDPTGR